MNAISIIRHTRILGAREFRQNLDQLLRKPIACRVMLHNKPALAVLPDAEFLALLEIFEELKGAGIVDKIRRKLQAQSRKKHRWFWLASWRTKELELAPDLRVRNHVTDAFKMQRGRSDVKQVQGDPAVGDLIGLGNDGGST